MKLCIRAKGVVRIIIHSQSLVEFHRKNRYNINGHERITKKDKGDQDE